MIKPANPDGFIRAVKGILEVPGSSGLAMTSIRKALEYYEEMEIEPACGNETCLTYGIHPPWLDCTTWTKGE